MFFRATRKSYMSTYFACDSMDRLVNNTCVLDTTSLTPLSMLGGLLGSGTMAN